MKITILEAELLWNKAYVKQLITLSIALLLSFSQFAQKGAQYRLSINNGTDTMLVEESILTGLRDSSIMIGTSFRKVNNLMLIDKPFTEVRIENIESMQFENTKKGGIALGSGLGLMIGILFGLAITTEEEGFSRFPLPSNKQIVLTTGLMGTVAGGIIGAIAQKKKRDVIVLNKDQKEYMSRKEYLNRYVFRY